MGHIISVHSFRRGVGKSNTTANVATLLAAAGQRVGVIDTNTQSPSLHILFNLNEDRIVYWLNDYLDSKCSMTQAAHNITKQLNIPVKGEIFIVPANPDTNSVAKMLHGGYDTSLLVAGFYELMEDLALDILMLDTGAGLDEDTLPAIAVADTLAILLRHDQRDYQGTSVIVEVARKLAVAHILLIINEVPSTLDLTDVTAQVKQAYNCEIAGLLPYSEDLTTFATPGLFALNHPDHEMTHRFTQIAQILSAS